MCAFSVTDWSCRHRPIALQLIIAIAFLAFAEHRVGRAQEASPSDLIRSGAQQMHAGHYAEAEQYFRRAAKAAPDLGEAHLDLGLVLLREGNVAGAVDELHTASRLEPRAPGVHLFLGLSYYRMRRLDEAIAELQQEIALSDQNAEAQMWLGIIELANGNPERAATALDRAAELSPRDLNILDYRAQAHSQVATESYARMRELDPDSWHVHRARAQNFADLGKPQDAIREYQAAIAKQPDNADLYEGLGNVYQQVSQFEPAARAYKQELRLNPENPVALYNLGRIDIENGDASAGVALMRRAVPTLTNAAPGYFYLGLGLAKMNHDDEALPWLQKSLSAKPSAFIEESAYFQLARVYQRLHRDQDAQRAVAKLKELKAAKSPAIADPGNSSSHPEEAPASSPK